MPPDLPPDRAPGDTHDLPVTAGDIEAAQRRIAAVVVRTPLVESAELSRRSGAEVALKLEGVQPTGSFKVRGAAAKLLALDDEIARRGVVTASTGNHGRAVAHVARTLGIDVTVCVSEHVPPGKVAALEALGCELVVGGDSQTAGLASAAQLAAERGLTLVHPFDDPEVIAGQGTIGLELLEQDLAATTVVVPLSGGGLISGVARAVKDARPDVRVIGVSMEGGAVMAASLRGGEPVELDETPTLADSLQGGIGGTGPDGANRCTLAMVRALVDDVVLVGEQQIWDAMRLAFDHHRLILEGAGAVGIAAVLAGHVQPGERVQVVCSGANAENRHVAAMAAGEETPPT